MNFLESVADCYVSRVEHNGGDLADYTFVCPNKRSAKFLKRYVQRRMRSVSFMPRFITMGRYVASLSMTDEPDRREQLFLLYNVYANLLRRKGNESQIRDFDRFIYWGEMILNDFDDIDMSLVDASQLFRNLLGIKEINADYLTEEQKQAIRQIWGQGAVPDTLTDFWTHTGSAVGASGSNEGVTHKFLNLWELLGELYADFREALRQRSMMSRGMQYRAAADIIRNTGIADLGRRHFVFVGFNDFSNAELRLLKRLRDAGAAEFIWDFVSPDFFVDGGKVNLDNHATRAIADLIRQFPMPDDYEVSPACPDTEIEIQAVPSGVLQAKTITPALEQWSAGKLMKDPTSPDGAINTAIVLPDESLLLPALLSLPPSTGAVNITMGMSYGSTPFCALLRAVVSMQMRARCIRDVFHFFHEDVMNVVTHPHMRLIAGAECDRIKRDIRRENLFTVSSADLAGKYPALSFVFRPVKDCQDVSEVHSYTVTLLDRLIEVFSGLDTSERANGSQGVELSLLHYYRNELDTLAGLIEKYGIEMRDATYFALFERLLSARAANLSGTPLRGLQMMGVLETRALDFDNVMILSLNERMFPRKSYVSTLIPNNLRAGYGMPTTDRAEWDYAYHFYRLLSRARRVKLIYDSRVSGATSRYGEVSRYITQLQHLHRKDRLHFVSVDPGASTSDDRVISVEKTPQVMDELKRFMPGGNLALSATALKTYKKCPLAFYLEYVKGYRGENEVTAFMDAATFGTIVHSVAEQLYQPYKGRNVDAAVIDHLLKNSQMLIERLVNKVIADVYYHGKAVDPDRLPAEGVVTAKVIVHFVTVMLRAEREKFCNPSFAFTAAELKVASPADGCWQVAPGLNVNFTMSIDRVDTCADGSLRFIDYKTGSDKVTAPGIDTLFQNDRTDVDAIFQLLTYCTAYADMKGYDGAIQPIVYPFKTMSVRGIEDIKVSQTEVTDYRDVADEFRPRIASLISEIFDNTTPFCQALSPDTACKYCKFVNLCGRTVRDDDY